MPINSLQPMLKRFPSPGYGTVEQLITLTYPGRVRFQGSTWKAQLFDPLCERLEPGDQVKIIGIQGITLVVVIPGDPL